MLAKGLKSFRLAVCLHPGWVIVVWVLCAAVVGIAAPSLTQLAAREQANLLPGDAESQRVAALAARAWPEQSYQSMAVVALSRSEKLTSQDHEYARRLARQFESPQRPREILRVLGPQSDAEVAKRLESPGGRMQLVAVALSSAFVSPDAHRAVAWLQEKAADVAKTRPDGLQERWTGDAVIGRDYMNGVQQSLDRAALATVVLLLVLLLAVYRSLFLAMVPLVTIGISLVVARGVLAWLVTTGWEVSPLVELFLVVVLFGSGTDFCLLLAWRFGEHWTDTRSDPAGPMADTLRSAGSALLTSAATVITGLSLMGTTRFKLFSSTGPSVALGLALTVGAALTLAPALLVLLARHRPRAFANMHNSTAHFWRWVGRKTLARPLLTWFVTLVLMAPAAVLGLRTTYIQDTLTEMPPRTPSAQALHDVDAEFGEGFLAPLTVIVQTDQGGMNLRDSEGLELIDEASRFLSQNRRLREVRSATQPLGSSAVLDPARISARLGDVDKGFGRMADGARKLEEGLIQGAAKVRLAVMLDALVHGDTPAWASLTGAAAEPLKGGGSSGAGLSSALGKTAATLEKTNERVGRVAASAGARSSPAQTSDPRLEMVRELGRAADGAKQIADGARRASDEVSEILDDPVGRHALDRLLVTSKTVREHPELLGSFQTYIAPDGRLARIDVVQRERMSSEAAMDQVVDLRQRLGAYLGESRWHHVRMGIAGPNAESADIRALTRSDQRRTWLIVPAGVFLILVLALRDPWTCLNLVATMILTYAFALGVTHSVFVTWLGDAGLDWKVPYFLFVLLVAVGVDYNVFLMTRLREETNTLGLRPGIEQAVAATGGLITSAASITACSFASLLFSPLSSLRQLGFALVVGVTVDAVLVRPVLVPCGHWLMKHGLERRRGAPEAAVVAEELVPTAV
ncbi:MAG: MMPL family transporter [Isosphaeraceae bacterium]|nr:MMPL family transporter [Isosphaeraceae bacterium]